MRQTPLMQNFKRLNKDMPNCSELLKRPKKRHKKRSKLYKSN